MMNYWSLKKKITQAIRDIEANKAYARSMVLTELNIALKTNQSIC